MKPSLDPKTVAATNPAVDVRKLEQLEQIRSLLQSAGLLKKAEYRLAPPLGTGANKPSAGETVVRLLQSWFPAQNLHAEKVLDRSDKPEASGDWIVGFDGRLALAEIDFESHTAQPHAHRFRAQPW